MAHTYTKRLDPDELRLLQPVFASQHGLYFRLITKPRKSAKPYTAVSYTWGSDQPTETIILDGKRFRVRSSLWACLYHLTSPTTSTNRICLWVDAICINQCDDTERASQVRLMDETYRDAEYVSVWLGLLPLGPGGIELKPSNRQIATFRVDNFKWHDHVENLVNRPYWKRFWVIQEFLLGREVTIYCGDKSIKWRDFRELHYPWTRDFGYHHLHAYPSDWAKRNNAAIPLIMSRSPRETYPKAPQPLEALLVRYSSSLCHDPRDRIFALLGLIDPRERRQLERFFPDYTLSEEEVLILTVAYLLGSRRGLCGHLTTVSDDLSDDLFLSLKIERKKKRREILRRARSISFYGTKSVAEAKCLIALTASASHRPHRPPAGFSPETLQDLQALVSQHEGEVENHVYNTCNGSDSTGEMWIDEFGQIQRRGRGWWTSTKVLALGVTLTAGFLVWRKLR